MRNVLIVSRNDAFRSMCAEALKEEGCRSYCVDTENGVFDYLRQNRETDLVIVNSTRSGEECHRLLDRLSRVKPHVSVLLSCDSFSFWNDFYTWLADACLVTPTDFGGLRDKVRELIGTGGETQDSTQFAVDWS